MANVRQSNSIFVDTDGEASGSATKVTGILFTQTQRTDTVTIIDGTGDSDPIKMVLLGTADYGTVQLDFSLKPLNFQTGIWIKDLSADCSVVFLTSTAGGSN